MEKNNQNDQKHEDMNVGSATGATTIRNIGEQHSGTNFKTRTSPVFTCTTFQTKTSSLLKAIKQGFLKTWPGLTEKLINKRLEKSRNTTMGQLHMRRQGLQSTNEKPPDTDL